MANGENLVVLVGNLGKDPEVRYGKSENAICSLRLALTERRKDGEEWKDHTEWVNVVVFGKSAENAGQYLSKGRQVYVKGRLQTREYEDKEGVKRWSTEVIADEILFLGPGNGSKAERGADAPASGADERPRSPVQGRSGSNARNGAR